MTPLLMRQSTTGAFINQSDIDTSPVAILHPSTANPLHHPSHFWFCSKPLPNLPNSPTSLQLKNPFPFNFLTAFPDLPFPFLHFISTTYLFSIFLYLLDSHNSYLYHLSAAQKFLTLLYAQALVLIPFLLLALILNSIATISSNLFPLPQADFHCRITTPHETVTFSSSLEPTTLGSFYHNSLLPPTNASSFQASMAFPSPHC